VEELLSVEEASAKLKIAPKTLRDWLRTGKLPGVKLGKRWLIRAQDLQAAIQAHLRQGSTQATQPPDPNA
jgi:excisionase family DNA binding protein